MEIKNKITALKPAVRTENRVNIFINEKFSFSLDVAQVINFNLKVGKILSDAEVEKLKRASTFGKLYTSTLEWVLTRPRSIQETRDYLNLKLLKRTQLNSHHQKNPALKFRAPELFSREDIENVIKKLIEKKYLDDEKFTKFYLENRFIKKGISERRLKEELRKKGIAPEIIAVSLETSARSPEDEILKVIEKKGKKYSSPEKLLAYLVRQGFPYDLSKTKVDNFFSPEI